MIRACLAFASFLLAAPAWATSSFQDLTVGGTVTVQGSAFSVGGTTLTVSSGKVGVSSAAPTDTLGVQGSVNANAYKLGGVAGTSVSCGASQALAAQTVKGGIVTSGSCADLASGAAVLNATQTFSGANSFTGQVRLTTGAYVNFPAGLNFTSGQPSFNPSASVTGSTVSFETKGTTVTCELSGSMFINNAGLALVNFMVDGGPAPGTSMTAGVVSCGGTIMHCPASASWTFQVTSGPHKFHVALAQSGGGTAYFLPNGGQAGQFHCFEEPWY